MNVYLVVEVPGLIVLLCALPAEDGLVVYLDKLPLRAVAEVSKKAAEANMTWCGYLPHRIMWGQYRILWYIATNLNIPISNNNMPFLVNYCYLHPVCFKPLMFYFYLTVYSINCNDESYMYASSTVLATSFLFFSCWLEGAIGSSWRTRAMNALSVIAV